MTRKRVRSPWLPIGLVAGAAIGWASTRRAGGVTFPIERPRVTLPFAATTPPYSPGTPHRGVDLSPFPGSTGRPIFAMLPGVVTRVAHSPSWFGNYVVTRSHSPATFTVPDLRGRARTIRQGEQFHLLYAHMHTTMARHGQRVGTGHQLGTIGSTGFSFGPHLHLELRLGDYRARDVVDPLAVLVAAIPGLAHSIEDGTRVA